MSVLAEVAHRSDQAVAQARAELVRAVRRAAAEGMTQAQIAREIGRSQPEVSRLLRFHGASSRAMTLRHHRDEVRRLIKEAGGGNVRVFGSLATGADHEESDIDLLFTMGKPLSLLALERLERQIAESVGLPVDPVPDSALRPELRDRVLAEAVPL
jgi:predicted nucleotidyltransferase